MELSACDFAEFFRAIHGHQPFPWQQRLVDCLVNGDEWPGVLDLPTGSGKTAALDAAVFHLALRSDSPGTAALRIALVVDRRLVVDDSFGRAEKIAKALRDASGSGGHSGGVIAEVARRLQRLAGRGNPPLMARRLRGGVPLEDDWARTPTQPTILCSTVDQVGSRLLFRGYGVSDRMKPVHAGLLGVNSLILLDEAHLSEPFRQTVQALRETGGASIGVALLSATPGRAEGRAFELSPEDREHPVLSKRLETTKFATIGPVVSGPDDAVDARFANEARRMMDRLMEGGSSAAVGVVVNRVVLARKIYEFLLGQGAAETVLLIGRSRGVDRDEVVAKLALFRTGVEDRDRASPLFVVATQCLEVGVDLDLDGLVTQAASLDALRQRFGRLNRAGRPFRSEAAIVARKEDVAKKADDPVYGDRIRKTWDALKNVGEGGNVDFGVEALPRLFREADVDPKDLATEQPNAPVLMPRYLDLWSQTSPPPVADPEVSLFLHGPERTAAGVSVVWRGDLSEADLVGESGADLKEVMRLVPPRAAETIEVPLGAARAWLRGSRNVAADVSDAPAREGPEAGTPPQDREAGRPAFRWSGHDSPRTGVVKPNDLRPGDLVVVPAAYGGCDRFGWAPDSREAVRDVADLAAAPFSGRRWAVRVAPDVARTETQWQRLSAAVADESLAAPALVKRLLDALPSTDPADEGDTPEPRAPRAARTGLEMLLRARGRVVVHRPYGHSGADRAILVAERGIEDSLGPGNASLVATAATEDETASHTSSKSVVLDDHCRQVACFVRRFLRNLDVDEKDDLVLAALLHDGGKADPRFQIMLSGGDPWNRPDGPVLAKSGRSWSPAAWAGAGLPRGWRHEALSVRMARRHRRFAEARDRKLVCWLIGSHHGRGRPFFGFVDSEPEQPLSCLDVTDWRLQPDVPGPQSLAFDLDGLDWPSLFEDLKRRYGIWGLAHLEAILRLADHRASEQESGR